jgi:hypothetical protein
MSEDLQQNTETPETDGTQTEQEPTTAPPAEAQKTDTPAEHMIPKSRFDEINQQLKELICLSKLLFQAVQTPCPSHCY